MRKKILVTGGNRSGKSLFAEELTLSFGKKPSYLATAINIDDEMNKRINVHKKRRKNLWYEYESPLNLIETLKKTDKDSPILIDCITLWLNNIFYKKKNWRTEVDRFSKFLVNLNQPLILVTNEVGSGLVPMNKLSRNFQDASGITNQILASVCDDVYLVVCGIPTKIKG
ncbi:MAG: bifunctional adenosylcobinamide kinase/adenosylcobinamide-phosphate guanylyltransferase [Crocinitomicaceae bacterium]|nr:bifunctional adenosylcobinamide kinase/adenosylcobinamide-phosphate guanylyltransferase [Crocinitomicaceae bacterium]